MTARNKGLEGKEKKMAKAFLDEGMVDMILASNASTRSVNKKSFEYKTVSTFITNDANQGVIKCDSIKEQQSMEGVIERIIQMCFSPAEMLVYQKTDANTELFALIICKPGSNAWDEYMSRNKVKSIWSEVKEAYNDK